MHQVIGECHTAEGGDTGYVLCEQTVSDDEHHKRNVPKRDQHANKVISQIADREHPQEITLARLQDPRAERHNREADADSRYAAPYREIDERVGFYVNTD